MRTRYLLSLCLVLTLAACATYEGYYEGQDYCTYSYCYPYQTCSSKAPTSTRTYNAI